VATCGHAFTRERVTASYEATCLPFRKDLLSYAQNLCRNPDTAEDVVQESLLKALQQWDNFRAAGEDPTRSARAWLYRIVHNTYMSMYRCRAGRTKLREDHRLEILRHVYNTDTDHTEPPPEVEVSDEIVKAMLELSDKHWEVILQVDLLGRHYRDVAADLGIPPMTISSRLFAARRILEANPGIRGLASVQGYGIRRRKRPLALKKRSARTRKNAVTLQATQAPQSEPDCIDSIVLGLDTSQLNGI
jgi:RNA polymerase sigma-70 factor, ECF subfamily